MRVLHISLRSDIGGGPEHVFQLGKKLNAFGGVEQYAAVPQQKPYFQKFQQIFSNNIFVLPTRSFSLLKLFELNRFVRNSKIELIHSHGKGAGLYSRLLKILNLQIKVVHTFHGWHVGEYSKAIRFFYNFYEFIFGVLTTNFICVSNSEKHVIPKLIRNVFGSKICVIPNGVEVLDGHKGYTERDIDVLIITRFDYQKNFEFAIDIAKRLPHINFTVLGEINQEGSEFRYYCSEIGLNNVKFVGGTNYVRSYMSRAKVILSTSRWEGLSLGLLEGMSEGCVPVLSRVTGNIEFELPKTLFFDLDDLSTALFSLNYVLNNPEAWTSFSEFVHEMVVRQYSVGNMASLVKGLYLQIKRMKI